MTNEKELIKKLFTIVAKQQKIITKLAQEQSFNPRDTDPYNSDEHTEADQKWILNAAIVAAANLNLGNNNVRVGIVQRGNVSRPSLFKVYATNLGDKQEAFKDNFYRTIIAQNRQDLSSRVTFELS